jgi:hypothetical protein
MKDIDTAVDLIYINDYADTGKWLPPFNERHRINLIEQDEQGAVLYVTNKSLGKTQVDGYYIYKHDDAVASNGNNADIYTFGSRVAGELSEHWQYRAELAYQFGNKNGTSLSATGANTQLSYFVRDEWNNNFRAGYEYRSGDDNTNRSFDALWGRHRPWGGLYSTYGIDALDDTQPNRSSNLHRPYVGWSIDLTKAITLATDYNLLFADDNISTAPSNIGLSDSGCFRGQLVTALLKHTINEHVSEQVLGELFAPGDYYSDFRNDIAAFLQYQLVFSW